MTAPRNPPGPRSIDLIRAAAILPCLRRGETMTGAEIGSELQMERHAVGRAVALLVEAGYVLAELLQHPASQYRPPGATMLYTATATTEWPEWLPMPPEAPEPARHGAITDAKRRGTVSSVWELGGGLT